MSPALEISFALWGMIVCAGIEAAEIFQSLFKISSSSNQQFSNMLISQRVTSRIGAESYTPAA